ncbi:MAG TPA: DUF418 domain-containing protein [Pseudoxanthomonas sp.]|nr:DUF418 domain-containing protein [Pseudoxanthomonas sp.]
MNASADTTLLDAPAGPLPLTGRVALVDTLRALALFGVILMNITSMVMMFMAPAVLERAGLSDMIFGTADLVLLQGKARSCFALLFGVGFGVMLLRAESAGAGFNRFFLRRMAVLLLFGAINQVFLFWGDILVTYALVGASLLLFRHWPDRRLLIAAALLVLGVPLLHGVLEVVFGVLPVAMSAAEADASANASLAAYQQPHYGPAVVAANLSVLVQLWASDIAYKTVYVCSVLGLFLLGLLIARRGILFNVEAHRPLLRRVAWIALPLGFVLSVLHATESFGWEPGMPLAALVSASYVGLPLMAFGYVATFALLLQQRAQWLVRLLAPAGRMALTNYLASGILGALVFHGHGLGLMGKLSMTAMNLLAIGIFAFLLAFSHAWLRWFRYGPVEWLWRSLSYGRAPRMRREHAVPVIG